MSDSTKITRKLAAIMFTDILGFTKIMGKDESTALSILQNQQSLIDPIVDKHNGNIIKKMGDGLLIEFPSTVEAVECATQIQASIKTYNTSDDNLEFHIRIGIHLGDVVILGDDILGDGVNIASRIEPYASPDGICITDAVYQSIKSTIKLDVKRIDEVDLKHIDEKYTLYQIPSSSLQNVDNSNNEIDSVERPQIMIVKITSEPISGQDMISKFLFLTFTCFSVLIFLLLGGFFFNTYWLFTDENFFITSLENLASPFLIILYLTLAILGTLYLRINTSKVCFQDIRNVITLTDTLIIQMGYEYQGKKGNKIEYLAREVGKSLYSFHLRMSKIKFIRRINTLTLVINGNTAVISGINWHVKHLIRSLKRYSNQSNP